MQALFSVITVLLAMMVTSVSCAATALTTPATTNVGANMATLVLQSSGTGTGYVTLLSGSGAVCGSGAQVKAGLAGSGTAAPYFGSLPLTAATDGFYTIRNLTAGAAYTVCFTAESPVGVDLIDTPATANLTTNAVTPFTSLDWNEAGSAGFSAGPANYTALAFAPDGTPYVAYSDYDTTARVVVMKFTAGDWTVVGDPENPAYPPGPANYTALAFAPDGTPFVAYSDIANSGRATLMKFDGADWALVGPPGFSAVTASATALAFAPDGTPYVAYGGDDYSSAMATVMKYSNDTWSVVGNTEASVGLAAYTSLAIAPDGSPHVAYTDYGNRGRTTVRKFNGTVWSDVGAPGFSACSVGDTNCDTAFTSLAFTPDAAPYVVYADYSSKATVMKYSSGSWETVGTAGFSTDTASATSLAISPDGVPYVAYVDGGDSKATVMKYNGESWGLAGSAGFSAGTANSTVLAFAADGTPCVAYSDDGNSGKATVMKLKNPPTISGTPTGVATVGHEYNFTPVSASADSFTVSGTLPPGLSFSTATGSLSGTPLTAGTYDNIVITATNTLDVAPLSSFSIQVFASDAPDTSILSTPESSTSLTTATFTFASSDVSATFECKLDSDSYLPCSSGVTYTSLAVGSHTFTVRAKNTEGNPDLTPAIYSWTVNSSAPTVVKIVETPYTSLVDSMLNATDGNTLKILSTIPPEDVNYVGNGVIKLEGGYDSDWSTRSGMSPVRSLTITSGAVIIDRIAVQ